MDSCAFNVRVPAHLFYPVYSSASDANLMCRLGHYLSPQELTHSCGVGFNFGVLVKCTGYLHGNTAAFVKYCRGFYVCEKLFSANLASFYLLPFCV